MVTCSNLKIKAYGKINLALDIVGKRDDGYHMLNTVSQCPASTSWTSPSLRARA